MKTFETTAVVAPDGTLTAQLPVDIAPGEHRIVLVIDDSPPYLTPRWEGTDGRAPV